MIGLIGRREKVRIGLFLIACTGVVIFSILALAGLTATEMTPYRIRFEESIGGLDEASRVKYLGTVVGKVKSIGIDPETDFPVVEIAVEPGTPVRADTVAAIEYHSYASGTRYIDLKRGSPDKPALPPGGMIPSRPSAFAEFDALAMKVSTALDNIARLVDEETKRELRNFLANTDRAIGETSERFAHSHQTLERDLESLGRTLEEAEGLLRENRPRVGAAIDELARATAVLREIAAAARDERVIQRAGATMESLGKAAESLARLADGADRLLAENRDAIGEILANFQQASRDLAEVSREVKERPYLLLRELDRGERSGRD